MQTHEVAVRDAREIGDDELVARVQLHDEQLRPALESEATRESVL
jgi:hypothetical protein